MDTAEGTTVPSQVYDAFMSYSHAADDMLAPRLQSGLQRFAKPWWKRRALRIFRDASSLSANPHLWASITEALDESRWFVLLMSPDAAHSEWVNEEIEYWKSHKEPTRILPVLTDGDFVWDGKDVAGDAAPPALRGIYTEEPRWVDMRFAGDEEQLDLKDPRFADAVADIASSLRGVPKDELASEEVKQHRRTIRTAWGAALLVGLLATAATVLAFQSADNARRAESEAERAKEAAERANRNAALATARELSFSSRAIADDDPELGVLLALEAIDATRSAGREPLPETLTSLWHSFTRHRVEIAIPGAGFAVSEFSPDGSILVTDMEDERSIVVLWDSETGEEVARIQPPELDEHVAPDERTEFVTDVEFNQDGSLMYVSRSWPLDIGVDLVPVVIAYDTATLLEARSYLGPPRDYGILDLSDGGHVSALAFPTATPSAVTIWPADAPGEPVVLDVDAVEFVDDSLIFGFEELENPASPLVVVDWQSGDVVREIVVPPSNGDLALSPDRTRFAVAGLDEGSLGVFDVETGEPVFPPVRHPDDALTWSADGSRVAVSGNSADATIVDAETGEFLLVLSGHNASVYSTAWHPSGEKLASIAFDNEDTRIWDVTKDGPDDRGFLSMDGIGMLDAFELSGRLLYQRFGSETVVVDPDTRQTTTLNFITGFPTVPSISGDGSVAAGTSAIGTGGVVSVDSGEPTPLHECASPRAVSSNGEYLAVATGCDTAEYPAGVIQIGTGEHLLELGTDELFFAAFTPGESPDGREYLAVVVSASEREGDAPYTLKIWRLDPPEEVLELPHTAVGNIFLNPRFSHDGRYLGVGTNGGYGAVIDMAALSSGASVDDAIVYNHEGHTGNAPRAVPSANGLVATSSFDGFHRIWDIETGVLIMEIDVGDDEETLVSSGWTPDGSYLYYMQERDVIGRLPIDPDEMFELAKSALTRSLTDDECTRYLHTDGCE